MVVARAAVFLVLVAVAASQDNDVNKVHVPSDDALSSGMKVFFRLYHDCSRKQVGFTGCLKMKAITFFDRVSRVDDIPLTEDLVIVKKGANLESSVPKGRALTESEIEAALSVDSSESRDLKLDNILMDTIANFFNSHTVQINFPKVDGRQLQTGMEEGRGKMKKMMGMMMMGMAMKMAGLIPIAIAGLFLLAGKALIVSKIALVLVLVIALKKILAQKQNSGHDAHHQSGGHGGGWDRRSLELAHDLAYRAQKPSNTI
ncbi:uncharacterized protein Osi12 [Anabrus simplex]|uniref:uncharacterized protein Osi12 n=1 Tax=Anabrus simplex TaxID=316456 RepID=UPI0035A3D247